MVGVKIKFTIAGLGTVPFEVDAVTGRVRVKQGPDSILIEPAAVPALIAALQAAAREAGDE